MMDECVFWIIIFLILVAGAVLMGFPKLDCSDFTKTSEIFQIKSFSVEHGQGQEYIINVITSDGDIRALSSFGLYNNIEDIRVGDIITCSNAVEGCWAAGCKVVK